MPKRSSKPDENKIAFQGSQFLIDKLDPKAKQKLNSVAALTIGRLGGLEGSKARAAKLTPTKRRAIA